MFAPAEKKSSSSLLKLKYFFSTGIFKTFFWQRHPSLFLALAGAVGISLPYSGILPLLIAFTHPKHPQKIGFFLIAACTLLSSSIQQHEQKTSPFSLGKGYLEITGIKRSPYSMTSRLSYKGLLHYFSNSEGEFTNIPCFVVSKDPALFLQNGYFYVSASLVHGPHYSILRIKKAEPAPTLLPFSKPGLRYRVKKHVNSLIRKAEKDAMTRSFLSSLATGDIDNQVLSIRFSLTGLRHTLAISGFHYTYLIILLSFLLGRAFSKVTTCLLLLPLISLYTLFIGDNPSLFRAWIAALCYLIGFVLGKKVSALNALGVALLFIVIFDPIQMFHVGLQLSFAATLGILLFYESIHLFLKNLFPKRSVSMVRSMRSLDQCLWILLALFRKSAALLIAAEIATLPFISYHFELFPLWGLLYNLFFPYLLAPILLLTFSGLAFCSFPLISIFFFTIAGSLAKPLVNLVTYGSSSLEGFIHLPAPGPFWLSLYLFLLLLLGIYCDEKRYQLTVMRRSI